MKTWLKGGLILAGLFVLLTLIPSLYYGVMNDWSCSPLFRGNESNLFNCFFILIITGVPFMILSMIFGIKSYGNPFLLILANTILWFLMGALIGWIVGKIRSRKKI